MPDSLELYAIHFPLGDTRPSKWSKVALGNKENAFRSPNIGRIQMRWALNSPRLMTTYFPSRVQSLGWSTLPEESSTSRSPLPSACFRKMSSLFVPPRNAEYATCLPSGDQMVNQASSA